jgi:hypothetical protein
MAKDNKDDQVRKIAKDVAKAKIGKAPDVDKIKKLLGKAEEVERGVAKKENDGSGEEKKSITYR